MGGSPKNFRVSENFVMEFGQRLSGSFLRVPPFALFDIESLRIASLVLAKNPAVIRRCFPVSFEMAQEPERSQSLQQITFSRSAAVTVFGFVIRLPVVGTILLEPLSEISLQLALAASP